MSVSESPILLIMRRLTLILAGKYSPKADEHCFTWCSQSVRGRYEEKEPWCRSICFRRVFEHEVQRLTSHFSRDSAFQLHAAAAATRDHQSQSQVHAGPSTSSSLASTTRASDERFPLPPEGQPSSALTADDSIVGGPRTRDVCYWQEGWYVWMTKNSWAVQERVEVMALDLEKQTEWMRVKEEERRAWAEQEREQAAQGQDQDGLDLGAEGEQERRHPYLVAS